ncbi:GntR family transcriptional regulator [Atopobiaceae bacterium 24-176]
MSKHEDIYRDLRKKILSGTLPSRSALESEEVLCKRYGVSRPTLRKALDSLKRDGLVHSRQGAGIFVNPPEFFADNNLTTLTERYAGKNVPIESRVLMLETVPAEELAEQFQIAPEDELIHYRRLRMVDGTPRSLEETWMPADLYRDFTEDVLYGSVIHYIEDQSGYAINHVNKEVSAVNAQGQTAQLLEVPEGTALLQIKHSVYMIKSVMVEYTVEVTRDPSVRIISTR